MEIDALRNLLIWFRNTSRVVQDLLLLAGDNAFRLVGTYYAFARAGARRKNPEAAAVYNMLRLFWKRRHRLSAQPTELEVERDFRALLRGTKDGEIVVKNESHRMTGGLREVVDDVRAKRRGDREVNSEQ